MDPLSPTVHLSTHDPPPATNCPLPGQLEEASLNHNQLNLLPASLGHLGNLRMLRLTHNRLAMLPSSIGEQPHTAPPCTRLRCACIVHTRSCAVRRRMPTAWFSPGGLTSLKSLFLDFNRLSRLPEEIGELRQLEVSSCVGR